MTISPNEHEAPNAKKMLWALLFTWSLTEADVQPIIDATDDDGRQKQAGLSIHRQATETVKTAKQWVSEQVGRRAVGNKPIPDRIGKFAAELHEEMKQAKANGVVAEVVSKGRIENLLRELDHWPVKKPPE
jgi:hypothetical protein